MKYKSEHLEDQRLEAPPLLEKLMREFDEWSILQVGEQALITRLWDKVDIAESGVHQAKRAVDFRDHSWSAAQIIKVLDFFNTKYPRLDGRKTLIWHDGTATHFHMQISWNPDVYPTELGILEADLKPYNVNRKESTMGLGESLKAVMKSKSYWLGVVKGVAYPVIDALVASTENELDDAGAAMGKQFLEQLLAEKPAA